MEERNMSRPIYVIGHKHSDLDSVASAYGYARLLQLRGESQATADYKEFAVNSSLFAICPPTRSVPQPNALHFSAARTQGWTVVTILVGDSSRWRAPVAADQLSVQ